MEEEKNQPEQNLYEGMYVLKGSLNDEERRKTLDKIKQQIIDAGGEIVKMHEQGRRRLAYEIQGNKEGIYYLLYFNALPKSITEFWKEYHLNADLLRFLILRAEKVLEKIEFKALAEQN